MHQLNQTQPTLAKTTYVSVELLRHIGGGAEIFGQVFPRYADQYAATAPHSHMLFLQVWVEFGLVGALAFIWYLFRTAKASLKTFFQNKKTIYGYTTIAGVGSILGISIMGAVEYVWFYPRIMLTFWIAMGIIWGTIHLYASKQK